MELRLANAEAHLAPDPGIYRVPQREAVVRHFAAMLADEPGWGGVATDGRRQLVRERDTRFTAVFDEVFAAAGIEFPRTHPTPPSGGRRDGERDPGMFTGQADVRSFKVAGDLRPLRAGSGRHGDNLQP
jgi:hypothetical protein